MYSRDPILSSLEHVIEGRDPHSLLGIHEPPGGCKVIRLWRPGADWVFLEVFGQIVQAQKIHQAGLFEYVVPAQTTLFDYRIYHHGGLLAHDPYAFSPTFGQMDQYLFAKGVHYKLYESMGGRLAQCEGINGAKFAVWAPNAKSVSLVADFNRWDGRLNPMRSLGNSGVWELFVPGLEGGEKYKFEIKTQQGEKLLKADPYALRSEMRPATASLLTSLNRYRWSDAQWMKHREERAAEASPMSIYELHLGSWKKNGEAFFNYREIAHQLADYCKEMGFNWIELLPLQEHPLDESWGYQVSGFYAVTSRFGTMEDFHYFVDYLHQRGIGIILDWVAGHFPTDPFSIGRFDGSALYEHADPRQGYHPHWHTFIFNFGRHEVSNFLIANALFWFEVMHIDALRVDAVASMLYLDYGREEGHWIPNVQGGKENLQAIEFLKHLNAIVHARCPGVLMIAEESTSFPGITYPLACGGLGFDFKWNMGWMNDTLDYFSTHSSHRKSRHGNLTFGLMYAFSETFILVFSHDEVVHCKRSLLSKMPGDALEKFAHLRLLFTYLFCQPGKKLLFMGGEIGQWSEWNCKGQIDWHLLQFPQHAALCRLVKELNYFYKNSPPLWQGDNDPSSFQWIDFSDTLNHVVSYIRQYGDEKLLCVHHFGPHFLSRYKLYLEGFQTAEEVFNSDAQRFGGGGRVNDYPDVMMNERGGIVGLRIALAPFTTAIFRLRD